MTSWPSQLPQAPVMRGMADSPASTMLRTQMDGGVAKVRRAGTAAAEPLVCVFVMTGAQWLLLRGWFRDSLGDGSLPYSWRHPTTGVAGTFRFTGAPTADPIKPMAGGGRFRVTCPLEALP